MKNAKDPFKNNALPPDGTVNDRRRLSSSVLFGARNEIVIVHNEEEYRLRITSNGKLILTK
ncbi:hemin uptake protein HemP [Methylosarcina fibrata]|uniref:hemin uptake protein HemP n=1 Tax=Methylosarcina fibrata TaxID=105972 RepID=UPI00035CAF96|nr:hemin uptake protein HemP [Methylosarcina fibrata]